MLSRELPVFTRRANHYMWTLFIGAWFHCYTFSGGRRVWMWSHDASRSSDTHDSAILNVGGDYCVYRLQAPVITKSILYRTAFNNGLASRGRALNELLLAVPLAN